MYGSDSQYTLNLPPIVTRYMTTNIVPNSQRFSQDSLPLYYKECYNRNEGDFTKVIDINEWSKPMETKIRDKFIKIRIRYSGKELAVIGSVITLYNQSYA